jgi:hypothetical protein
MQNGRRKLSYRFDIENHKEYIKKILRIIELSKVSGFKANTQKSIIFLYTSNKQ